MRCAVCVRAPKKFYLNVSRDALSGIALALSDQRGYHACQLVGSALQRGDLAREMLSSAGCLGEPSSSR